MRNLTELVNQYESVWLFTESEKYTKDFLKRAIAEGFKYQNDSKISYRDKGILWGVHKDFTIAHISMFVWCLSYKCDSNKVPVRIDYKKYIDGENVFFCHKSPIKVNEIKIK